MVLALAVVAFRLTARFTSSGLKWDDFFITWPLLTESREVKLQLKVTIVITLPFTIIGFSAGIGRHTA
jgi:hypothetical protein